MKYQTLFLIIFFTYHCATGIYGTSLKKNRIYGGSEAKPGEFPYMVSVRRNGRHDCGGALITVRHVLTAYHCVGTDIRNLTVAVGSNSRSQSPGDVYGVQKALVYPPFDGETKDLLDHDIAVVTLDDAVKLSQLVSTIPLPDSEVKSGVRVQFTGWGDDYTQQNSEFLQKLKVTTVYNDVCKSYYRKYGYEHLVRNHTICTIKAYGSGACFGDSGGPLVYNNTVIGVLSVGFDTCAIGIPDLFESVYYYLDFITYAITHR